MLLCVFSSRGDKLVPEKQWPRGAGSHDAAAASQAGRGVHGPGQQAAGQGARAAPGARLERATVIVICSRAMSSVAPTAEIDDAVPFLNSSGRLLCLFDV